MENNNLDFREDELNPTQNQDTTTYAEELTPAVDNEIAEVDKTPAVAEVDKTPAVAEMDGAPTVAEMDGAPTVAEMDGAPTVAEEVIGEGEVADKSEDSEQVIENSDNAPEEADEESEEVAEEIAEEMTEEQTAAERKGRRRAFLSGLYDYAEIFAVSIIAVIIVFSFCFRLCQVDGQSMRNTLENNERIIACDLFYTPKQGDIIVFHLVNDSFHRPLVKRVIATEGQTVEINYTDKKIYVDGVLYEDKHSYIEGGSYLMKFDFDTSYMSHEDGKLYYRATVPEGKVFVLGDNRNNSTDSRSAYVGFVDEDCILGKAVLRLDPFTVFE